jgi:16S rRNA (cytosine967-C5)-methyltransferase
MGGYRSLSTDHLVFTANPSVPTSQSSSLASQLQAAADYLQALQQGTSWSKAQWAVPSSQRPGVQAICFAVLRNLAAGRALRRLLAPKQPSAQADALLTAALGLLCAQNPSDPPPGAAYAEHVIVSQAVEAAKAQPKLRGQQGFINAVLRRFLRERAALLEAVYAKEEVRHNLPAWWLKRVRADWPQQWQAIAQANRSIAPLTLRVSELNSSIAGEKSTLFATNLIANEDVQHVGEVGLQLSKSLPVPQLPGYSEGWFSVQDAAAQLAAPLLLDALAQSNKPWKLLDACAAPGGKTTHLLEWAAARRQAAEVLALDSDAERCERIYENLQRLKVQATVKVADAAEPAAWHDGALFDGILLDAPCTAAGIVRRHPDIPWLRRETDIAQLAAQQKRLLAALWPLVKPGGALLYCTCSVFKAEGSGQIEAFLAHNTNAKLLPSPGHLFPQNSASQEHLPDNQLGAHDGFFYALLQKTH